MTKEAALEWQAISTTPKDGTRVLVSATLYYFLQIDRHTYTTHGPDRMASR